MNTSLRPHRIQRSRAKGWRMPEGAIYVGRPTMWGNPWIEGRPGACHVGLRFLLPHSLDATQVVDAFAMWLRDGDMPSALRPPHMSGRDFGVAMGARRDAILSALPSLAGRSLACWCPPICPCHADVLLEMANA